jgi:hypothetical protein
MSSQKRQNSIDALVSSIVSSYETQDLLNAHGLKAHSVTWEDTARTKGSCWGPNISDMTLVVKDGNKLMPVIRKPNFSDVTCDVPIDSFRLRVGNESKESKNAVVGLKSYLEDLNLHDDRDSVILTSSQCCVLPVEKGGKTQFAVQLFNYQSYDEDPAVLVILVTKDGTSTQIVERSNQKLFFNKNGMGHWFSVERLEDVRKRNKVQKTRVDSFKEMKEDEKLENTIMMIQVPLKQKERVRSRGLMLSMCATKGFAQESCVMDCYSEEESEEEFGFSDCRSSVKKKKKVKGHGMDMGQIGLGDEDGKFIGTKGLTLVRDTRFPIRCTFQYYRVTDENYVTEKNIVDIAEQLAQAANVSVAQGSLVMNEDSERTTEPDLKNPKPSDNPFGKIDERDYLKTDPKPVPCVWGNDGMASFN